MRPGANLCDRLDLRRFGHSRREALQVSLVFIVAGALWILVTDVLLYRWVADVRLLARLETAKGWAFVAAAALLIYTCVDRALAAAQRSDAMRRAILENMNDGVFLVGPSGTVIGVNAATARMLGVSDPNELIGWDASEASRRFRLSTPDGKLLDPQQYSSQRALRGETVDPYVAIVHPPNKPPLPISITSAPVRATPDGPVELSVTILRDVGAIHRLEQMRDEFFSAAAHALKTPVTTISLHAQLLTLRETSAAARQGGAAIERQCVRIEWLVRNLLVASRMRNGGLTFHMEPVDVPALALATAGEVRAREPSVAVDLKIQGRSRVFADRERLGLALSNLIVASPPPDGKGECRVRLTVTEHHAHVRVSVEFRQRGGAGDEMRARFDRTTDAGLELFVCEKIIEGHGSRLERAAAEPGASRTWFELPALPAEDEART